MSVRAVVASATVAAALSFSGNPAEACSASTACEVENGEYFIAIPESAEGPVPALLYLHGGGGSGSGAFRNTGLVNSVLDRGYAFIAPSGLPRPGGNGRGGSWAFHPDFRTDRRDDIAFITSVRDDVIAKNNIDPNKVVLGGFSIGGSMTAYLACEAPEAFSAYIPVGGNFWRPHPTDCAGPVRMMHTHGWTDGTVPLEGRPLGGGRIFQGDVFQAMSIWRETNGCVGLKADKFEMTEDWWIRTWEKCDEGTALQFTLFPGGHGVPKGWADLALGWYEGL